MTKRRRPAPGAIGNDAEEAALRHLQASGLTLVARNYRFPGGELDLVMEDAGTVVFVEVRFRRSNQYGGALASIDQIKQARIIRAAQHYLQRHRLVDRPCRIDVVAIEGRTVNWIRNAIEQ